VEAKANLPMYMMSGALGEDVIREPKLPREDRGRKRSNSSERKWFGWRKTEKLLSCKERAPTPHPRERIPYLIPLPDEESEDEC
jgi:hypothetical protein